VPGRASANYTLGVLVVVYVFNFLDRQIVSILAERIKSDLGVSDAQIGFLYGTAFAVFYAVFGIPLGRLADVWDRRRLIALGLAFWSAATAVSGLARNFGQLAAARIAVGIGEASATPAAFSLLSDLFPPVRRATVLAIYSGGIYIGAGLGLGVGGLIVDRWDAAYAGAAAPFGLAGWQVAFLVVGLPGLLLAGWVATLREPPRGVMDGLPARTEPHPWHTFGRELRAVVPPFTLLHLVLARAGRRVVAGNLAAAAAIALGALALTVLLGTPAQWVALGVGLYAAVSWTQALALRDRPAAALILNTPTLRAAALGFACLAFTGYGLGFWLAPFLVRAHGACEGTVGLVLGGISAVAGWLGVTAGGVLADRWHRTRPHGRLLVGLVNALVPLPFACWLLWTDSTWLIYVLAFPLTFFTSLWIGPGAGTVQDLVLPRMRAVASAAYLLVVTFIGLALGPYAIGRLSVALGDLRLAMACGLVANLVAAVCLAYAARRIASDGASVLERARAAGEDTP
jgi:MFS family permease